MDVMFLACADELEKISARRKFDPERAKEVLKSGLVGAGAFGLGSGTAGLLARALEPTLKKKITPALALKVMPLATAAGLLGGLAYEAGKQRIYGAGGKE